jgi:ATP-dependent Clp protease adapter protein ClpS
VTNIKKHNTNRNIIQNSVSFPPKKKSKNLILYGAPFTNKDTVSRLLQECVEINKDRADDIIKNVEINKYARIITCDEMKAHIYCKNLIDNGLCVFVEEV